MLERKKECEKLLTDCLVQFQLLEEALKDWVIKQHQSIKLRLGDGFTYNYASKEYEKSIRKKALGEVIYLFELLSDNNDFIGKIKKLRNDRNDLAHSAFHRLFSKIKTEKELNHEFNKLIGTQTQLADCTIHLITEISNQALSHVDSITINQKANSNGKK